MARRLVKRVLVLLQDTVVALQALAKYAAVAYTPSEEVSVLVKSTENFQRTFNIESANRLVLQQEALTSIPGVYTVEASGQGCVYVQASRGPRERSTRKSSARGFPPQRQFLTSHFLPPTALPLSSPLCVSLFLGKWSEVHKFEVLPGSDLVISFPPDGV